jgi:purine-nucleoside phosphorylase
VSDAGLPGRLDAAAEAIRKKAKAQPLVGLVLGSGLGAFAEGLSDRTAIAYDRIPNFPVPSGVVGHAGELVLGSVGTTPVVVLSGRIHFYEGRPMADVIFPARVLVRLGIRAVILTNAAGGVRLSFRPGDLMLLTDHINSFGTNPLVGENEDTLGQRFPDMSVVYDDRLRRVFREQARRLRIPLRQGVYVGLTGPSYETPAEIRMWRKLGADAVGMSTVPEVIVAVHAGLQVLGISVITDLCLPDALEPVKLEDILATAATAEKKLRALVRRVLEKLP